MPLADRGKKWIGKFPLFLPTDILADFFVDNAYFPYRHILSSKNVVDKLKMDEKILTHFTVPLLTNSSVGKEICINKLFQQ